MKIGFIGVGHMGKAISDAVANRNEKVMLCDHHMPRCYTSREIAREADVIVLGVKPQALPDAIHEIKNALAFRDDVLIVSMCAGTKIETIKELLEKDLPVMRIMPNTPIEVGEGVIAYSFEDESPHAEIFLKSLMLAGEIMKVDEDDMDGITALCGSGPAFVYRFINSMARGGEAAGLSKEESLRLATQTVIGAATLLKESGETPDELCEKVCSPGGTTIAGIEKLDSTNFEDDVIDTVVASFSRSCELSK